MAAPLLALLGAGCSQPTIPPFLDRGYAQLSLVGMGQDLQAEDDESSGPYVGAEILLGTRFGVDGTTSTGAEIGAQVLKLDPGGDLEGTLYRYLAGLRRTWRLDRRVQPSAVVGLSYSDFHLRDHDSGYDPNGPGAYVGGGLEYVVTPGFAIGVLGRYHVLWMIAEKAHIVGAADVGLTLRMRF